MCCMQSALVWEADSCPTTKMAKFLFKKRKKKKTVHARTGPAKPVNAVCWGSFTLQRMMEIMRKYILNNDLPVYKPQAIYSKIKRCQKVPACSLSTNTNMFKQQITWKKQTGGRPGRAEVTSSPLYIPLFETYISTARCRHFKIYCHSKSTKPWNRRPTVHCHTNRRRYHTAHRRHRTPQLKRSCSEYTKSPPAEKYINIHNYKNNKSTSINHPNMCNEPQWSYESNNIIHRW